MPDERDDKIDFKTLLQELREMNAANRAERETFRDALKTHASRTEVRVAIEGLHDYIRTVAEGSAERDEAFAAQNIAQRSRRP